MSSTLNRSSVVLPMSATLATGEGQWGWGRSHDCHRHGVPRLPRSAGACTAAAFLKVRVHQWVCPWLHSMQFVRAQLSFFPCGRLMTLHLHFVLLCS